MFPKPIEKSSRAWQIGYQGLLPLALILWLLPLIAVAVFSIKPDADFTNGNYWGVPSSFELFTNYGKVFLESDMPQYMLNSFLITIPTVLGAIALSSMTGFALGIYLLPILTAPASPDAEVLAQEATAAEFTATLTRDLAGSDALHWGEGTISVTPERIVHQGELAPGPDYKVYLAKDFVEDGASFEAIKDSAVQVGEVKSFEGFLLDVPEGVNVEDYNTVVVWCESFGVFITAGQYA